MMDRLQIECKGGMFRCKWLQCVPRSTGAARRYAVLRRRCAALRWLPQHLCNSRIDISCPHYVLSYRPDPGQEGRAGASIRRQLCA